MITHTDSYKFSHYFQYPQGAQRVSSYIEARGCERDWDELVFVGLQYFIEKYLMVPVTMEEVNEMADFAANHGVPFNFEGWKRIVEVHNGYLPITIKALPEGTIAPISVPLVQVENNDEELPWLTSYIETALLRAIWYPTTVATQAREIKKIISQKLAQTGGSQEALGFMLNDFGARGVSSFESAQLGGFGHLTQFVGTDNIEAVLFAREYYNESMAGFSVIASEHSTMTSWGRENEVEAYRNMLANATPNSIISVVSDSYDIYNACENIWGGELKDEVNALAEINARLVVRPDSGNPLVVPIKCVDILMKKFGYIVNDAGYRVLPDHIRVIQGDGVNEDSIKVILRRAKNYNIAAENFVFGMGGAGLQKVDRDTLKFAMKANAIKIDGVWHDVYKDPLHGGKTSKRGRQEVVMENGKMVSYKGDTSDNLLKTHYENGVQTIKTTLAEIREKSWK